MATAVAFGAGAVLTWRLMKRPYTPPAVWTPSEIGGKFAGINRPTSGPRLEKVLPKGDHALQLYSMATPNGVKVTILLEEFVDMDPKFEYDAWLISIMGDQFGSDFCKVNPNSKIPALLDCSTNPPTRIFESGSILLYLCEKFDREGRFLPKDLAKRTEVMNWLFWQMGAAPYLGGGFGHFYTYAPEKIKYAIDRFSMETKRQLDVLDKQLANNTYICGDQYTIADMAIFPWYGRLVQGKLYDAADFLNVSEYPNVKRWAAELAERPAVKRGDKVNRSWGPPEQQVPERHSRKDLE